VSGVTGVPGVSSAADVLEAFRLKKILEKNKKTNKIETKMF